MKFNMELRVLIAEDSQENIDTLSILLKETSESITISGIAKTLVEAEDLFRSDKYDIAFLDIQFKMGTIFEVLDRLLNDKVTLPEIVFVTAHGSFEYATRAIKYACLDFINKPIDPAALHEAVTKSSNKKATVEEQQKQVELLLQLIEGDVNKPSRVAVILPKNKIEYVEMNDLQYITADGNTSIFYLTENKFHSTRHLGYYIDLFEENSSIVQINRSCVVNRSNVKNYQPTSREVTLTNGDVLTASFRASKKLKSALKQQSSSGFQMGLDKLRELFQ